jgi:restriction system protein
MAVPDYQMLMLPLLRRLAQQSGPAPVRAFVDSIADEFQLTEAQRAERIPSGLENLLANRLAWARTYLGKAGLLSSPRRGLVEITGREREALKAHPDRINVDVLRQYPEFSEWMARSQRVKGSSTDDHAGEVGRNVTHGHLTSISFSSEERTPRERIDAALQEITSALTEDLLNRLRQMSPSDFEDVVLRLLLAMGYGQGLDEMARALGGAGDGGMDGVIHQDPLGLERVYIQAKRWKDGHNVSSPEIRDFVGALNIHRANKGVFVTASQFTSDAVKAASSSTVQVVLIDGPRLTELMVKYKVGILVRDTVELKAIDEGFFEE